MKLYLFENTNNIIKIGKKNAKTTNKDSDAIVQLIIVIYFSHYGKYINSTRGGSIVLNDLEHVIWLLFMDILYTFVHFVYICAFFFCLLMRWQLNPTNVH